MQSIKDKVVVITGASRGIGKGIAEHFANEKAKLVLCGRDQNALDDLKKSLSDSNVESISEDIRTKAGMNKIVTKTIEQFNSIDIFINNAGVGYKGDLVSTSEEEFDEIFETNLKSVFYSFKELIPIMKKQGRGHIINISSMAGKQGVPGIAVYSTSKAALNTLSEAVGAEVRKDNIKVSVLAPGSTATSFMSGKPDPLKKSLTVDDVAEAVLNLARQDENTWQSLTEIRPLIIK